MGFFYLSRLNIRDYIKPMFIVRYFLILCIFVLCHISFATAQDKKIFNAEEFMLENGMRVVVIPNHRIPVVMHMVWYAVGAADEPHGQSGVAHFLEHLMFKGSEGLASGEFSRTIQKLGGQDNAFTGQDYTAYYQSISKEHLGRVMQMEAGRMRGMAPSLPDVESERSVVLEERSQCTDNNPSAQFSEHLQTALYVHHPYGSPVIGWRHEIESLQWDQVKAFYDTHYAPNNAILVVSGDVTGDEVFTLAQKHYGALKSRILPERVRTQSPPLSATPVLTMHHPNVKQAQYRLLLRVPSCRQNREACLALEVLENIMSGGATSRLYDSLVVQKKIASHVGVFYSAERWDDAFLALYATPVAGQDIEATQRALDQELEILLENSVTQEEVDRAISRIQAASIYARDSLSGPAMTLGSAMITGSKLEDIEYKARDIANVTAEQIYTIVQDYLNLENPETLKVRGYLLPAAFEPNSAQSKDFIKAGDQE